MKRKSSTKPQGATSYEETSFGIIPRSKLLKYEIKGTKKGLDYIYRLISENPKIDISSDLILKIHKESFGWIFPDWAGRYRTIRVEFSGKETALPHQISELIINLCADLKERKKRLTSKEENYINEVVSLLAWFQHRFVWIHPFQDYNGRLARMLTILILLSLNLPMVEISIQNDKSRQRYLEAMYDADDGKYSRLETIIGNALAESLSEMVKYK